jgi:hypothetical protein
MEKELSTKKRKPVFFLTKTIEKALVFGTIKGKSIISANSY